MVQRSPGPIFALRIAAATSLLALAATAQSGTSPAPLLWPLPIMEGCPSIFGESRDNHLHGGLDFRTHREEGWAVLAPADGAVERIRREPSGYGRVLYLRLDDGRTVVFGHLCRFEDAALGLESRLRAECARAGTSFPGDVAFRPPVRVQAGQTLAYAGQLGIGSPHLHMEVRAGDDQLDPFSEGLPVPGGLGTPRMLGLVFLPRSERSLVAGGLAPLRVEAVPLDDGTFALEHPVSLRGPVDVALVADDAYGTDDVRCGVNEVWATLDGAEFFRADIRRFDLRQTFQSPALWAGDLGWDGAEALHLRRDARLTLPGVSGSELPTPECGGEAALRVYARNRAGGTAQLSALLWWDGENSPPPREGLPVRSPKLVGHRFLPGGVLLEFAHRGAGEEVPFRVGGVPWRIRVEVREDVARALVPLKGLPLGAASWILGEDAVPFFAQAGPSVLECDGIRLRIPEGAYATAVPGGAGKVSASFRVWPPLLRAKARVVFPSGGVPGTWACGPGGRYMGGRGAGEVPYRGDGTYALRTDREGPTWGKPFRTTIPHIGAPEVRVPLKDTGSGPDLTTLRVKLDGAPAYPDWDVDGGLLRFDASGLAPGRHTLSGTVRDRAGNRAVLRKLRFTIPGG